jgi:hypothetical protein
MAFAAVLSLKLPPLPEEEHDSQSAVESE